MKLIHTPHEKKESREESKYNRKDVIVHSLKDINTIVKNDMKTIIEHDMITRVKGTSKEYIEQDVKKKYLQNFFHQVGKDARVDVQDNYHLKAKHIKFDGNIIELLGDSGVTLRCGGHALTVAPNGVLMKSNKVDTASPNTGVKAANVAKPIIKKPLYEKIRVIELIPSTKNFYIITYKEISKRTFIP